MVEKNRIDWIDGVKGLACVLIFVHHFLLLFYPATYFGDTAPSYLNGIDVALASSPFAFLINGNFLVMLFCCISGIVISNQVMTMQSKEKLADVVVKRYLRLLLPMIPIALLIFLFLKFGLFANQRVAEVNGSAWASWYYKNPLKITEFLKSLFSTTWFYGDDRISTSYWMLSDLFTGTFLSILLSVITWKYKDRAWIVYVFVIVLLFNNSDFHLAFCLGTLLAWLYTNKQGMFNWIAGIICLIIGLFLGAYPSGVIPNNIYSALSIVGYADWHAVGAILTLYGLFSLKPLQKFFALKPFTFLGKISYSVYLIHIPLSFCLSAFAFLGLQKFLGYNLNVLIVFVLSVSVLIVISWLYSKYVERSCVYLQGKLMGILESKNNKE